MVMHRKRHTNVYLRTFPFLKPFRQHGTASVRFRQQAFFPFFLKAIEGAFPGTGAFGFVPSAVFQHERGPGGLLDFAAQGFADWNVWFEESTLESRSPWNYTGARNSALSFTTELEREDPTGRGKHTSKTCEEGQKSLEF
ncbi:hypothetical protein BESB_039300 [Besnoitia besnoiti]|uniref:Uncharacterized protein n=1 Tax=Besnoitia besnoiti TaxID=94643 RepID=A0A2A9MP02_BESBE|nr:hypothetical protein BESB_039300 [Besnoitia besnoiti]PFH37472.1 hypothetical protein BESB_039300 [Besnoitia besnoiti]